MLRADRCAGINLPKSINTVKFPAVSKILAIRDQGSGARRARRPRRCERERAFFEQHLRSAVEHQLAGRGYVRTSLAGPPDLRVRYHVNFSRTVEISGGAASPGACSRDCEPDAYAYEQGTLVVDLVDVRTNEVVWSGWSRDNMDGIIDNQQGMERKIDRVVAAMFERIPSAR